MFSFSLYSFKLSYPVLMLLLKCMIKQKNKTNNKFVFLMYLFIVSAEKRLLFKHLDLEKKMVHVIPLRGTFISDNDIQKHVLLKADIYHKRAERVH